MSGCHVCGDRATRRKYLTLDGGRGELLRPGPPGAEEGDVDALERILGELLDLDLAVLPRELLPGGPGGGGASPFARALGGAHRQRALLDHR
jgi:hypothetical protein